MNKEELSYLEQKAQLPQKSISFTVSAILILPPLLLGLYYWFVDDILFNYNDVAPFSGFFIFFVLAIIISIAGKYFVLNKWKNYNATIEDAIKTIEDLINSNELPPEDLFRLKKDAIERKLNNNKEISQKDFLWHSNRVCWGCGKFHGDNKVVYTYTKQRTVSWKEGVVRYNKTYSHKAEISLCPTCYKAITSSDKTFQKNQTVIFKIDIMLCIVAIIIALLILEESFGNSIAVVLMGIGICTTIGQIIIFPLSYLIAKPFTDNTRSFSPKWYFDNIPSVRNFMNQDLRH